MDCQECNELLPLYIDQSLTQEEIQTIRKHMEGCTHCKEEMELLTKTLGMVKNLECVDAPADFHARFQKRFQKECHPGFRWGFWGSLSLGSVAAAAAVLLVVVLNNPLGTTNPVMPPQPDSSPDKSVKIAKENKALLLIENDDPRVAKKSNELPVKTEINAYPVKPKKSNTLNQANVLNAGYSAGGQDSARKPGYRMNATTKTQQPELVRQRGEWSGNHCNLHAAKNQVARNQAELTSLWQSTGIQSIAMPPIDWSRNMVGLICLGDRQGRGYEIMLKEVGAVNKTMTVKYLINSQNIIQDGNITQPFIVFTMPKSGRQVLFEEER